MRWSRRVEADRKGNERVGRLERVRKEDSTMKRVRGGRVDGIGGEEEENKDQRVSPCVAERKVFPSAKKAASFSTFGVRSGNFVLRGSLEKFSEHISVAMMATHWR